MNLNTLFENISPQQRRVGQLPADFSPRDTSPVLDGPYGKENATQGYLVGEGAGDNALQVGDPVIITGNVEYQGRTGDVREIGRDGAFVVVNLYNHGPYSFHASDVSLNDYADSDEEDERAQGVAEGHADQQRKIFKKNGQPVGEVGIDRESSPGVGQYYMKHYASGKDLSGFDSFEEAVQELRHLTKQGVAEGLDEAVGGNYLYHATSAGGLKGMLSSGGIKAAIAPQTATKAQTKLPTVSVTRDWGYASGVNAQAQGQGEIFRDVILVLNRNAVESNFKTLGTSQSGNFKGLAFNPHLQSRPQNTDLMARNIAKGKAKNAEPIAKAGGEFEEAVVVPKGALPLKGTMVGFWINPKSELTKDPAIMNDPRRLDMIRPNQFVKATQQQGVTETALRDKADLVAKRRALQDLSRNPGVDQRAVQQRQQDLEKEARSRGLNEFALDDGDDPTEDYPCYDCGSTIFLHHTKLCDLAEPNAKRDLPAKPGSQVWTGEIPKGLAPIPGLAEGVAEGIEDNYNKNDAGVKAALQSGVKLIPIQPNNDATGKPIYIHDYSGRYTVIVDMGGISVPFYVSTGSGGKATVAVDKWYPFFGIGSDGWINKGSEATINDFYGSNKLKRVAQVLDNTLGLPSRAKNVTGWSVNRGDENYFISIVNRGLDPAARSDRSTKLRDNMLSVLRRLGEPNKYVEKAAPVQAARPKAYAFDKNNPKHVAAFDATSQSEREIAMALAKDPKSQGVAESVEFMSDAQFYGELLSVLAAMGAGLATGAYLKARDIVKMYNADRIMRALEGHRVSRISDSERKALIKLIAEFKQAMAQRQGEQALAIAKQIKSIATDRAAVAEAGFETEPVKLNPGDAVTYQGAPSEVMSVAGNSVTLRHGGTTKSVPANTVSEAVDYAVMVGESVKRVFPVRVLAENYAAQLQQRRPQATVTVAEQHTTEDVVSAIKDRVGDYLQNVADAVKKDPELLDKIAAAADDLGSPVKTITTADGHEIKIHGNEDDGFRISIHNQALKSRFPKMEHAVMATEMYCARRQQQKTNSDYLPEA